MHLSLLGFYFPLIAGVTWLGAEGRNRLEEVVSWSQIDFSYPSEQARQIAISTDKFIPKNNLPLGLGVYKDKLFVTLPRWKKGIPATLATVSLNDENKSPPLTPYPNWAWHSMANCNGMTSVFRVVVDECDRLWVLDAGIVEIASGGKNLCPAKILVFDLTTDRLLWRHVFPKSQILPGSLLVNIAVELVKDSCEDAFAYVSDVFRYTLHVFNYKENISWRVQHPFFHPEPLLSFYEMDGIKFQWTDGVFGLAVSPEAADGSGKTLYFHPLSSNREFSVRTSFLHNQTSSQIADAYKVVGEPRKKGRGQSSGSAMDKSGVLFYNLVARNAVGCWNSRTPHAAYTQGIVSQSNESLSFPNDLRLDNEADQGLWVLSNKLHKYLYTSLQPDQVNFRVLTAKVRHLIKGTPCDLNFSHSPRSKKFRRCKQI